MHESAHLIIAKKCGCGVDIFSIGFGKPIYRKEYRGTIYQFSLLLLGGYCKLEGELDGKATSSTAFTNLPYRKKVAITSAGCAINILSGLLSILLGLIIHNFILKYFGILSIALGLTNLLPIPALDGSYPILVWLEKFYGKEKGYAIMQLLCKIGFILITILNVACIPYLIYLLRNGGV